MTFGQAPKKKKKKAAEAEEEAPEEVGYVTCGVQGPYQTLWDARSWVVLATKLGA